MIYVRQTLIQTLRIGDHHDATYWDSRRLIPDGSPLQEPVVTTMHPILAA